MTLAFLLNEYRPYGGMSRDCVKLAQEAASRGHRVDIVTRSWQGETLREEGIRVHVLGRRGWSNASRDKHFTRAANDWCRDHQPEVTLGFLRMSGIDAYFAADPCYLAKVRRLKPGWYARTPRHRRFARAEAAVFSKGSRTQILLLHPGECDVYQKHYGTEPDRLHVLPPGIQRVNLDEISQKRPEARFVVREELGLAEETPLLLLAGSGFRTKGLDRAIQMLVSQPQAHLAVAGQDHAEPFRRQADQLGVAHRVHFLGGRADLLDRWMLGCDLLVHPAYSENTGTVLLEAIVRGLPVVASSVCGFAPHLTASQAGRALAEPFTQSAFDQAVADLLADEEARYVMRRAGGAYGVTEDLYSCHQRAVDVLERIK